TTWRPCWSARASSTLPRKVSCASQAARTSLPESKGRGYPVAYPRPFVLFDAVTLITGSALRAFIPNTLPLLHPNLRLLRRPRTTPLPLPPRSVPRPIPPPFPSPRRRQLANRSGSRRRDRSPRRRRHNTCPLETHSLH